MAIQTVLGDDDDDDVGSNRGGKKEKEQHVTYATDIECESLTMVIHGELGE